MEQLLKSLGPVAAVIGAQWGDEGKGKVIDMLTEHFDVVARACGGANAGHTIVVNGKKHVFRLLPSGCLHDKKEIILGSGMVIHLPTLFEEIDLLKQAGIDIVPRLKISRAAHIVLDVHKEIDAHLEEKRAKKTGQGIGTTKRGIGPAYMDKMARWGLRMEHVLNGADAALEAAKERVQEMYGLSMEVSTEAEHFKKAKSLVGHCITDTVRLLHGHIGAKKRVLIEGAQAALLDIDHGTYPFVTSSSTTASGALQGLGLPPNCLTACIGVAKAYCTRVGSGDFPTEIEGETGDRLRERGGEYGSVTKRPRRCGWLHIDDLKFSKNVNGFTHVNITKLDVLDTEKEIPVGIGYDKTGKVIYEVMPGWQTSTSGVTSFADLPKQAQDFLLFIEKKSGMSVNLIGTGQGRGEMIIR